MGKKSSIEECLKYEPLLFDVRLYVYMAFRLFMSGKLYWRIKKNGRWTWTAAHVMISHLNDDEDGTPVYRSYEVRELEE